jgi:uncharacterized protein
MKLQPDRADVPTISGHGLGWLAVDGEKIFHSVVIATHGQRLAWDCTSFQALDASHFAQLAQFDAEVVIFGSGDRIRFPQPAWLAPLMARRIGLETMDTAAACRTYNILAGEGRKVVLAALIEGNTQATRIETGFEVK